MSRTNIDGPTLAALQAVQVQMFVLVELDFDSGRVYLSDLPVGIDVEWSGNTYLGAQAIGTIEPITETDTEAKGIAFTLSAVNQAAVAGALTEEVQGREALLRLAIVDGTTLRVDPNVWSGVLDVMTIEDDGQKPVIRVTAEHMMIAWQQPSGALFSDAEQKARHPGDKFFEFVAQVTEATIVWPGREFFQQ
jgi:hypothetical protein